MYFHIINSLFFIKDGSPNLTEIWNLLINCFLVAKATHDSCNLQTPTKFVETPSTNLFQQWEKTYESEVIETDNRIDERILLERSNAITSEKAWLCKMRYKMKSSMVRNSSEENLLPLCVRSIILSITSTMVRNSLVGNTQLKSTAAKNGSLRPRPCMDPIDWPVPPRIPNSQELTIHRATNYSQGN